MKSLMSEIQMTTAWMLVKWSVIAPIFTLSGCWYAYPLDKGTEPEPDCPKDTEPDCPPGFDGEGCSQSCDSVKLDIHRCAHAFVDCSKWVDEENSTMSFWNCPPEAPYCAPGDYDLDLGQRRFVHRFRFLTDYWFKRPDTWALLASDDNVHFSLVMSGESNHPPWQCVQGNPCSPSVPEECCPGGVTQDTSVVGSDYPRWDDYEFAGVVARYWRFRVIAMMDSNQFKMREVELFGNACLGSCCDATDCGAGVCTGQSSAFCTCSNGKPETTCTSAFVNTAPRCATPEP